MSATGRNLEGRERKASDDYPTPAWAVDRILDALLDLDRAASSEHLRDPLPWHGRWLEPCAGDGAVIRAVRQWYHRQRPGDLGPDWDAVEIRAEAWTRIPPLSSPPVCGDFLELGAPELVHAFGTSSYDVLFTNPPYGRAVDFWQHGRKFARHVVLLLRLPFLESAERHPLLSVDMPDVYILPNRPSFAHGRTDSTAYAWMHWKPTRQRTGHVELLSLTSREDRQERGL